MKREMGHLVLALIALVVITVVVAKWTGGAASRLAAGAGKGEGDVAIAQASDEGYCSAELKQILRRVLTSCGLVKDGQAGRGCQPLEAKNVASMSGEDFNALFRPLASRAAIIQFDQNKADLDGGAVALLDQKFSDQRGASYFLVVSRSSPEGSVAHNRELSEGRAGAVLAHLRQRFTDPDLDSEVGLLWLGEEFAQLDEEFCKWNRSRSQGPCTSAELNRSAFVAWIDCRL